MVEFKIQLEESLVQRIGYREVERQLQVLANQVLLKLAAGDILNDLPSIDLENDEAWQLARKAAWEQEQPKYTGRG